MSYDKGFRAGLTFSATQARLAAAGARASGDSVKWHAVAGALDELAKVLDEAATPEPPADPAGASPPDAPTPVAPAAAVAA